MIFTHLVLFEYIPGAGAALSGGVESAAPTGIFIWFDGASPAAEPEPSAPSGVYRPTWRPRRR